MPSQLFHLSVIRLYGIIIQAKHGEANCNNEDRIFMDTGAPISISCLTLKRKNMMKYFLSLSNTVVSVLENRNRLLFYDRARTA